MATAALDSGGAGWKKKSGAGTGWAWDSRCRAQLGGEGSECVGVSLRPPKGAWGPGSPLQETKAGVWGGVGVWGCGGSLRSWPGAAARVHGAGPGAVHKDLGPRNGLANALIQYRALSPIPPLTALAAFCVRCNKGGGEGRSGAARLQQRCLGAQAVAQQLDAARPSPERVKGEPRSSQARLWEGEQRKKGEGGWAEAGGPRRHPAMWESQGSHVLLGSVCGWMAGVDSSS